MSLLQALAQKNQEKREEVISLSDYLELCKVDPMAYATAAERMLKAIGEPEIIDTSKDSRLSVFFEGRTIKTYPSFKNFYGIEDDIEEIRAFFKHAAQGLEESKQILFLLGDVGSGKSSIADKLKELMEMYPIYVLTSEDGVLSPVFDNPLGLFISHKQILLDDYGIEARYVPNVLSPWALKRLKEYGNDATKFKVTKIYPQTQNQIAIAKTEPLDDNNADIGTLVGKVNMRQLQYFSQSDADAYNYSGALCRGNRGLVEMAEMYKANIKTLNPLLEASQSRSFNGLEQVGSLPFDGIIVSHSNKSEWSKFRSDKKNEALLDRILVVKIHYSLRYTENMQIYQKMIDGSELRNAPIVPETLEILSKFDILTRLEDITNSNLYSKMRIYNGDNIKAEDNRALPYNSYKEKATQDEGLSGSSTRKGFKILSQVYNHSVDEVAADPVTLFMVLKDQIIKDQHDEDTTKKYLGFITDWLEPKYVDELGKQIQRAYVESYSDFAQAKFDRYYVLASAWVKNADFADPITGILLDREAINKELSILEKTAGIGDPKDFRGEIVFFILTQKSEGKKVKWSSYKKLAEVIEKSVFKNMEDLLPVISFGIKTSEEIQKSHKKFIDNMVKIGYTERQVRNLVAYYISKQHS